MGQEDGVRVMADENVGASPSFWAACGGHSDERYVFSLRVFAVHLC